MLPFLMKPRKADGGVITEHRPSDKEPSGHEEGMEAAAKDVLEAISSQDVKRLSKALQAAFEIYELMPHEEFEHEESEEQE